MFRLLLFVALVAPALALPEVTLGKVVNGGAGGSMTAAMTAELDGRVVFVKSRRGSEKGTRYANLEADVLAASIFARVGVRAPSARLVRLSATSTCRDRLGDVVQIMELVDEKFAGGRLLTGFWPTADLADVDAYIKIALVDLLIGNADRRDSNFFVGVNATGVHTPIPIDNNSGFGTMITWSRPTDQMNFVKSYDGLAHAPQFEAMGTIANIVRQSPLSQPVLTPAFAPRVLALEQKLHERLDDGWWSAAVALVPGEMLPPDLAIDPRRDLPDGTPLPAGVTRGALFGGLAPDLPHDRLVSARRQELRDVFAWRRDHLRAALTAYLSNQEGKTR